MRTLILREMIMINWHYKIQPMNHNLTLIFLNLVYFYPKIFLSGEKSL